MNKYEFSKVYNDIIGYKYFFYKKYKIIPEDEVESLLHLALAKGHKHYKPDKGCQFKSFVLLIMHNECKNYCRDAKKRYKILNAFSLDEKLHEEENEDWYDYYSKKIDDSKVDEDSAKESVNFLKFKILPTLKKRQYEVLNLYLKGYKTQEVAEILGISHQAVWGAKSRFTSHILPLILEECPYLKEHEVVRTLLNKARRQDYDENKIKEGNLEYSK